MTRETKIALFVGMGVIILIGILISDHLSEAQRQTPAELSGTIDQPLLPPEVLEAPPTPAVSQMPPRLEPPVRMRQDTGAPAPQADDPFRIRQDMRELAVAERTAPPVAQSPAPPAGSSSGEVWDQYFEPSERQGGNLTQDDVDTLNQRAAEILSTPSASKPPLAAPAGKKVHYLKPKESLASLAREYYSDTNAWRIIAEANGIDEDEVSSLQIGMRLEIPNVAERGAIRATSPKPAYIDYTLKRGESLSIIAERFLGSPAKWRELDKINKGRYENPHKITAGTVIRVPKN